MKGVLYGIGVGIGNANYLTLEGYQLLQEVGVIIVPIAKEGVAGVAYQSINSLIPAEAHIVEQVYPMAYDQAVLSEAWDTNLQEIEQYLLQGQNVVFLTIGDPFVYSTYSYMYQRLVAKGYMAKTVPGITSFQAVSAKIEKPLVQSEEKLAVIPGVNNLEELCEILRIFDTVVILKVSRMFDQVTQLLAEKDLLRTTCLVSNLGLPNETVYADLTMEQGCGRKVPYLSTMIIYQRSAKNDATL